MKEEFGSGKGEMVFSFLPREEGESQKRSQSHCGKILPKNGE